MNCLRRQRGEESMKEEDNILKKVGTGNSFKVPEGYFENITSEIMGKLPEKEKVAVEVKETTMWTRMKPLLYLAAMFIGAALIIRVVSVNMDSDKGSNVAETEIVTDQMIDVAVDKTMMDDYSLYVYLNDVDAE